MKRLHQHGLIGSLLLAAGMAALAQGGPPPTPGNPPPAEARGPRAYPQDREQMRERMTQRHAKRLTDLKAKLKLTPEQESAWNSFTAAMQPPATPPRPLDREAMAKLSTPERIDRMNSQMNERQEQMRQRWDATKGFYATLSDEQKKIFDREMGSYQPLWNERRP